MKQVSLYVFAAMIAATSALAAGNFTEKSSFEYPLDADGSVWIDNPFGNIEVIGSDSPKVSVSIVKITRGVDAAALAEGRAQTVPATRGDHRMRQISTAIPDATSRSLRWQSFVSYTVRAPRTAHIKVSSTYSDRIRITDISADVTVKNVAGEVLLDNVSGPVVVDSVNGNITYIPAGRPAKNAQLATVNGRIQVVLTPDASFQWVADTIQGDFRSTFAVTHPRFNGRTFHGIVNGAANPTITTSAMMGDVFVLRAGTTVQQSHSVRVIMPMPQSDSRTASTAPPPLPAPVLARHFQAPVVDSDWEFATNIGNIAVGEVRGDARVITGAGTVQLSLVAGQCNVTSHGGELDLGDIIGPLTARTDAGSISVRAARSGGTIVTGGGMVQVMSTGGPVEVSSGGGDVIVRQANGNVSAQTRSGDISISIVQARNQATIEGRTGRGNVTLNVSPRFAADIDATIVTSDAEANRIESDLTGLTIRREPIGQRTRIHATGKVNGGGERVALYAEEGDIRINAQPSVVVSPQP